MKRGGFTLIEALIVVAIIAILASFVAITLGPVRKGARDARRKAEVAQVGRLLSLGCFVPQTGSGDYDLAPVVDEILAKYPNRPISIAAAPRDPLKGTATESFYRYAVNSNTKKCAVYANLENADEAVTLPGLSAPSAGGGTGVLQAPAPGWNGTDRYFQFSN